jgi:hypothetical protein
MAAEDALNDVGTVLQQVEPIGDLGRRRRALPHAFRIGAASIPTHYRNARMGPQPRSERPGGGLRQQVQSAMAFEIDQDRAVATATSERPVIHAEDLRGARERLGQRADQPQQSHTTDRNSEWPRQPRPRTAAQGAADGLKSVEQAARATPVGREQRR